MGPKATRGEGAVRVEKPWGRRFRSLRLRRGPGVPYPRPRTGAAGLDFRLSHLIATTIDAVASSQVVDLGTRPPRPSEWWRRRAASCARARHGTVWATEDQASGSTQRRCWARRAETGLLAKVQALLVRMLRGQPPAPDQGHDRAGRAKLGRCETTARGCHRRKAAVGIPRGVGAGVDSPLDASRGKAFRLLRRCPGVVSGAPRRPGGTEAGGVPGQAVSERA